MGNRRRKRRHGGCGRTRPAARSAGAEQFEAEPTVTRAPLMTDEAGPSSP
ncbi:MAG TPA: hypothetical protein VFY14_05070 [Streptomyces sp.]|nr:hypothetical protein [Streptomyces sp.]